MISPRDASRFMRRLTPSCGPRCRREKVGRPPAPNRGGPPAEPNLPTVKEAGYPGLTIDGLVGLFGPAGMPLALRERIAADMRAVAADPIIADRLTATGQILNIG